MLIYLLPQCNIKFIADATLNNIKRQLNWIKQVMEAYNGEANIIFYYAGHGIPNESNGSAYLLPVDGIGNYWCPLKLFRTYEMAFNR